MDDGSTDSSGKICEEFAASDPRARVIHHGHNIGLWAARNTGQDAAAGEYLWFPDGDDYFHQDIVKVMYEAINRTGSDGKKFDLAIVGYKQTSQVDEDTTYVIVPNLVEKSVEEAWEVLLRPGDIITGRTIWSKLCRRESVADIRTGCYIYAQDTDFSIKLFNKNPKTIFINNPLYYWLCRISSNRKKKDYKQISYQCLTRMIYDNYKSTPSDLTVNHRYLLDFLYTSMLIWQGAARGTNQIDSVRRECRIIINDTGKAYLTCKGLYSPKKRIKKLLKIRYDKIYQIIMNLCSNG